MELILPIFILSMVSIWFTILQPNTMKKIWYKSCWVYRSELTEKEVIKTEKEEKKHRIKKRKEKIYETILIISISICFFFKDIIQLLVSTILK